MRQPLNVMLSVKPHNADAMTVREHFQLIRRIANLYSEVARRNDFPATYVRVSETLPDNSFRHFHLACYVPVRSRERFIALAFGWMPQPDEIDARPISQKMQWLPNGKSKSSLGYMIKNMTPQAAYFSPFLRKKGGIVEGSRWGCSLNLKRRLR